MANRIQLRRDTRSNFLSNNVILAVGEPALTTNDKKFYIGDGVTAFSALIAYGDADLSGYATDAELNAAISGLGATYATDNELNAAISGLGATYATDAELSAAIANFQTAAQVNTLIAAAVIDGGNAAG